MANDMAVSGTSDPYSTGVYSPGTNSKNTLTIESFFKLLSAQLANQDMTNPMDNSEMTAQLTNMAMVQSLTAMTTSIQNSTAVSTQTYAAGWSPLILHREIRYLNWKTTVRNIPCPMSWALGRSKIPTSLLRTERKKGKVKKCRGSRKTEIIKAASWARSDTAGLLQKQKP